MKTYSHCIFAIILYFIPLGFWLCDEHSKVPNYCQLNLNLERIILCTLNHSPEYKMAKFEWEAALGRRKVEEYRFPSNPVISVMASNRSGDANAFLSSGNQSVTNGEILFSQEIYIGGQRQSRIVMIESELKSLLKKIQAIERFTIDQAIRTTYLYQTSLEELSLYEEYLHLAKRISEYSKKRLDLGLGTRMDYELAHSEYLQAKDNYETILRTKNSHLTDLIVMMGLPYSISEGNFPKNLILPFQPTYSLEDFLEIAKRNRPDLEALEWDRKVAESKLQVLEKEKIPNPIISGFIQNDGFNERVLGVRMTIPIPIVRDKSGEIQEAKSLAMHQSSRKEVGEHTVRQEAINAWNGVQSWKRIFFEYDKDSIIQAEENLKILSKTIEAGTLSVRESILLQRSFLNHRVRFVQAKRGYALALAEYFKAGGLPYLDYFRNE